MNQEAAIKREKRKAYDKHWTAARSAVAHTAAFFRSNGTKGHRRHYKAHKLAQKYRQFFADPAMRKRMDDCKVGYLEDLHPRLCRDIVLGSQAENEASK